MNERPTLRLMVRPAALPVVHAELQVVHVSPNGIVDFPNRSEFEITHFPGSPDVFSNRREFRVDLTELGRRQGQQIGHLYAVMLHSQPRTLDFLDGMELEAAAPGFESVSIPLNLGDHAALLGVWWQNRAGGWAFEYSGQILDTLNATYQAIFLLGRYAERFADQ